MKKSLLILLMLGFASPCNAIDGATLKEWCHQVVEKAPGIDPMTFRDGYCMGMTEGVVALARQHSLNAFCAPESLGAGMLLRTILAFLDTHPEKLRVPAEAVLLEALGDTYPCKPAEPLPEPD